MNTREFKLKKLELEIQKRTLELKEKQFILKKYQLSLSTLLKIYIYPFIALLLTLFFKSNELSDLGFEIIFITTIIFFILVIITIFMFIYTSEKEIAEKINNKHHYIRDRIIILFISIILGSFTGYYLATNKILPKLFKTSMEVKEQITKQSIQ